MFFRQSHIDLSLTIIKRRLSRPLLVYGEQRRGKQHVGEVALDLILLAVAGNHLFNSRHFVSKIHDLGG